MSKTFKTIYVLVAVAVIFFANSISDEIPQFKAPEKNNETYNYEFTHGEIIDQQNDFSFSIKLDPENEVTAELSPLNNFNKFQPGDEVQLYKSTNKESQEITYEIADFYHQGGLLWIFVVFAAITVFIARHKGLTAIFSVGISLSLFYFLFLKMIMVGYSPLTATFTFVAASTILTVPLIHGFNKKSLSAIIAIFIGYLISIFISIFFKDLAQLGNTPGEEFRTLAIVYQTLSLSDILIASLFMGAVGALVDTAISISSAIFEAIKENSKQTFQKIYKIGMEVGKDILGSMINTLLFAYLASALPFLIIISITESSTLSELINMDFIALELTRTLVGALSLVILIPITASISAYFFMKEKSSK
jgi:uncharacterized membrane protein